MLDRGVLYQARLHNDNLFPFRKIKPRLEEADLLFGNLESVISDKGFDQGGPYSFRAPPKMTEGLAFTGFDVVSLAHNHAMDWTVEALMDSRERLRKVGIKSVGAGLDAYEPVYIELGETTVSFLAYTTLGAPGWRPTENTPGVAMYDEGKVKSGIEKARKEADLVITSFHYGIEYETEPSQNQRYISKKAIDTGADLVIGHHPHVIQPVEEYKGGIIAYSLGNFIFDQGFSEETMRGLLLEVWIRDGEIVDWEKEVVPMNEYFQPHSTEN